MKLPLLMTLLLLFSSLSFAREDAYLNIEDDQIVSVFNKEGQNWKTCRRDPECKPVAWPDNTASIKIISPVKKMSVENPFTGDMMPEEYVQIEYKYDRTVNGKTLTQEGKGWVDAAYLLKSKKPSFFGNNSSAKKKEYCEPKPNTDPVPPSTVEVKNAIANQSVRDLSHELSSVIGQCAIDPKKSSQNFAKGNIYDNYILPGLNKQKPPAVLKENGEVMNNQDLIDIDSLSRTIYGEMAGCFKYGLQYPMTVAKIAVNRAETPKRQKEFIRGQHNSDKGTLSKVVTSPSQFSVWRSTIDRKPNGSLKLALCPPADKQKPYWQGRPPSQEEQAIWENTIRIATEAVLFPKKFKQRTAGITDYHYTSGMDGFHGMKQVFPWIGDRKVSKDACVQVWSEKKS